MPGSQLRVDNVMLNPTRAGFYETLREMGADISLVNERHEAGERVADIIARHSSLEAVRVPASRVPSMIDEYPILAVLTAFAHGESRMEGLGELRVKESDRLASVQAGLAANGVEAIIEGDDLIVRGRGGVEGGGVVRTHMDHRLAMSFLVMGMASRQPVTVDDGSMIETSFPGFIPLMKGLGARFEEPVS